MASESESRGAYGGNTKSVQDLDRAKDFEIYLQDISEVKAKEHLNLAGHGYVEITHRGGQKTRINLLASDDPTPYNKLRAVLKDFLQSVPPIF